MQLAKVKARIAIEMEDLGLIGTNYVSEFTFRGKKIQSLTPQLGMTGPIDRLKNDHNALKEHYGITDDELEFNGVSFEVTQCS